MTLLKKFVPFLIIVCLLSSCTGQGGLSDGYSSLKKKEFDKAIEGFTSAIEKGGDNPDAYLGRALAQAGKGEHGKALNDYNTSLGLLNGGKKMADSLVTKLYVNRGLSFFALEQYAEAKTDFTKAIELNYHDLSEVYAYRGVCWGNLDDVNAAFKDLDKAISLNPKNHYAVTNRGYYNSLVGDNPAAIRDHTLAIQIQPDDKVSYLNRGYTYLQMGNDKESLPEKTELFKKALGDFYKSYEIDTNYMGPVVYIGITKTNMGDNAGALPWFNKAIPWQPDNPTLYYYRGTCLANLERFDEACPDLHMAAEKGEPNALPLIDKFCK